MALLAHVPRGRWCEADDEDYTLLHHAAQGDNPEAAAVLLARGVDASLENVYGVTALHIAVHEMQPLVMEQLLTFRFERALLLQVLERVVSHEAVLPCLRVLLANGVRLSSLRPDVAPYISDNARAVERGVLRCRSATVALLVLKRRRGHSALDALDRWMHREIALACWTMRTHPAWQK